eukprot:m.90211 g.90211  ORF g.90211 m.90211 type:complete len:72 (+) comp36640_c0_seq5:439-654(+)
MENLSRDRKFCCLYQLRGDQKTHAQSLDKAADKTPLILHFCSSSQNNCRLKQSVISSSPCLNVQPVICAPF